MLSQNKGFVFGRKPRADRDALLRRTKVDPEDSGLLDAFRWCFDGHGYVTLRSPSRGYKFHRVVLGLEDPAIIVDHINRDKADNRKRNLRIVTHSQNHHNSKVQTNNTSGYPGVHFVKRRAHNARPWFAYIKLQGARVCLGYYASAEEAARIVEARRAQLFEGVTRAD